MASEEKNTLGYFSSHNVLGRPPEPCVKTINGRSFIKDSHF